MEHLIGGLRDPKALAPLARGRARRKISQLEEALEGAEFFTAEHAALLAKILERIDRLSADIDDLTKVIERLLAPYEEQLQQAESMPGWGRRAAQDAVAGTGVDMNWFPADAHLVSWGGRAPLDHQSGTRKGRAKAKKGNRYLAGVLGETAASAGRTQTREGARYRRLARRRGKLKAQVAVGEHPAEGLPQAALQPLARDMRTSARTTMNAGATSAARSPITSASSAPSASKSPSPASPNPERTDQDKTRPPDQYRPTADPAAPNGQGPLPPAQLRSYFRVSALCEISQAISGRKSA
jgi:Transposase IS116/IS110/IS902 family